MTCSCTLFLNHNLPHNVRWLTVYYFWFPVSLWGADHKSRLRQSWYSALNEAEAHFRELLSLPPAEWKRLSNSVDSLSTKQKGKAKVSSLPELSDVLLHRRSTKGQDDVYRIVFDAPMGDEEVSLEPWKAVLTTPELRKEWDPAVDDAYLVEVFDHTSRICKTNYTLGWPSK